jgi:carboxyl-terminal processing protease
MAFLAGQKYPQVNFDADPKKAITTVPVAVLVGRSTAGPAELLAAAVLDNQRGDLVGDKTFGEGSVQKLIEMPGGSAMILSIAKYYRPNGKVIQEEGITPNVEVASTNDLAAIPDDENQPHTRVKKTPARDEQLERALQLLASKSGR